MGAVPAFLKHAVEALGALQVLLWAAEVSKVSFDIPLAASSSIVAAALVLVGLDAYSMLNGIGRRRDTAERAAVLAKSHPAFVRAVDSTVDACLSDASGDAMLTHLFATVKRGTSQRLGSAAQEKLSSLAAKKILRASDLVALRHAALAIHSDASKAVDVLANAIEPVLDARLPNGKAAFAASKGRMDSFVADCSGLIGLIAVRDGKP